jgi:hypothetical protein
MLSTHLFLGHPSGLFPSGFPINKLYVPLLSTHGNTLPTSSTSSSSFYLYLANSINHTAPCYAVLSPFHHFIPLWSKYSPQHPVLKHCYAMLCYSLNVWDQISHTSHFYRPFMQICKIWLLLNLFNICIYLIFYFKSNDLKVIHFTLYYIFEWYTQTGFSS